MEFKLTFHIKMVSFKNIDIWPIYGPKSIKFGAYTKYGHIVFLLITQPFFRPI